MDYGILEYSITKGFRDKMIINFFIDQKLQTFARLKERDRISVFYNYATGEGMIFRAAKELPQNVRKTECPPLNYSSSGKRGKLKAWYNLEEGNYWLFLLLPTDKVGQIELKITEVNDGSIFFSTGKPKTIEEVIGQMLTNYSHTGLEEDHLNKVQKVIRDLKNGKQLDEILNELKKNE